MPLLDHFHPPLSSRLSWKSLYCGWATRLADALTDLTSSEFVIGEFTRSAFHADIASFEPFSGPPPRTVPTIFPDSFEVRVFSTVGIVVSVNWLWQLGHQAMTSLVLLLASLSMVASAKRPDVATSPVRICTTPQQWVGPPITL